MTIEDRLPVSKSQHRYGALRDMTKLETILYPTELQPSCPLSGVILVSLDVEYDSRTNDIDQIGIATLASTALLKSSLDDDDSRRLVTSHLLLLKRQHIPRNTRTRQYLYGTAQPITAASLSDILPAILTPTENTKVVLVGHEINADILAIKRYCGLDLKTLPCVATIFDTAYLPSYLYDLGCRKVSLKRACRLMGIPGKQLHNAGNDAYYTLKVLILSFRFHKQREIMRTPNLADRMRVIWEPRLNILERIGKDNAVVGRPPKKIRDLTCRYDTQSYDEYENIFGLATYDIFGDAWDQSRPVYEPTSQTKTFTFANE